MRLGVQALQAHQHTLFKHFNKAYCWAVHFNTMDYIVIGQVWQ